LLSIDDLLTETPRDGKRIQVNVDSKLEEINNDTQITTDLNNTKDFDYEFNGKEKNRKKRLPFHAPHDSESKRLINNNAVSLISGKVILGNITEEKEKVDKKVKITLLTKSIRLNNNKFRDIDGLSKILDQIMYQPCNKLGWVDLSHN
jgi:hypothetical protein